MSGLLGNQLSRGQLRSILRQRRRALSPSQQRHAAESVARRITNQWSFRKAKRVAVYLANDGEINLDPLIQKAWQLGKKIYLPVVSPRYQLSGRAMWFVEYRPDSKMRPNRFGIMEPSLMMAQRVGTRTLDLVLMPLVGFDNMGRRLGMGGGFYDRAFSFKHHFPHAKPRLIGVAHSCQQVDALAEQYWDVPMSATVTEDRMF